PLYVAYSAGWEVTGAALRRQRLWSELAADLAVQRESPRREGAWVSAGLFRGTSHAALELVGRGLVALDIETSKATGEAPAAFDDVIARIKARGVAVVAYTTHSSAPDDVRYRLIFPLSAAFVGDGSDREALGHDHWGTLVVAFHLGLGGVVDRSKLGANALFYGARHKPGAAFRSAVVEGDPVDAAELDARAMMTRLGDRMSAGQKAALDATLRLRPE